MEKREFGIDVLRTIGILFIFLAHVNSPFFIQQMRIFDVILMVIISGYVYKEPENYFTYIKKRGIRLLFPTWVTLTIFFISVYILKKILKIDIDILKLNTIMQSYLLIHGIGFVWIIRIYLVVAILGPLILKRMSFLKLILYFVILEIIIEGSLEKYNSPVLEIILFQTLPYVLLFCYGNLLKNKKVPILRMNIGLVVILLVGYFTIPNLNLQEFKYPPRSYYIAYGTLISNILFYFKEKIKSLKNIIKNIISYIGKSTMWFYLIHIFVYYLLLFIKKKIKIEWYFEYIILVLLSFHLLIFKDLILFFIEKKIGKNKYLNIFKG